MENKADEEDHNLGIVQQLHGDFNGDLLVQKSATHGLQAQW